jgi:hypothetical protein
MIYLRKTGIPPAVYMLAIPGIGVPIDNRPALMNNDRNSNYVSVGTWMLITPIAILWTTVVAATAAQTNKPIIFPPQKWDASKHLLAPFVASNKPGKYPLPFEWVGFEKVTARTGWYTNQIERAEQTNVLIDFDRLAVLPKPLPIVRENHYISHSKSGFGAGYRRSLPSDAELLQIRDVSSVTNFLGAIPSLGANTNATGRTIGIRFFTLGPLDSIATLQVTFDIPNHNSRVAGILVKRAVLYPQSKPGQKPLHL